MELISLEMETLGEGHDFSRAAKSFQTVRALAPGVKKFGLVLFLRSLFSRGEYVSNRIVIPGGF
jgi:hypothetical protein